MNWIKFSHIIFPVIIAFECIFFEKYCKTLANYIGVQIELRIPVLCFKRSIVECRRAKTVPQKSFYSAVCIQPTQARKVWIKYSFIVKLEYC